MPDEILTLPEVAQLFKVAEKTLYTMGKDPLHHGSKEPVASLQGARTVAFQAPRYRPLDRETESHSPKPI